MDAEKILAMTDEEFIAAASAEAEPRNDEAFNDDESLDKQILGFANFRQSKAGIKKMVEASRRFD